MERQIDGQTDRWTDRWTDRQTDRQTDICDSRVAFGTETNNKSKLTKHPVPVNTVNTKIISTFVASIPIFASIQHISPHLGTTLIQIIY